MSQEELSSKLEQALLLIKQCEDIAVKDGLSFNFTLTTAGDPITFNGLGYKDYGYDSEEDDDKPDGAYDGGWNSSMCW